MSVSPNSDKPGEILSLTSFRGGLAVWVVLYHFWQDVLKLFPSLDLISPIIHAGIMAVPAFFMLSGFVLAYNYVYRFRVLTFPELFRFILSRFARIYPVHLFTLLIVAAMVWVSGRFGFQLTDSGYTAEDFVRNLFLIHTWVPDFQLNWNYPSWSISSEWFAYLIFPFAASWGLSRLTTPFRAYTFGLIAMLSSIAVVLWWNPWPYYHLVQVIPTFFAGAALYWMPLSHPAQNPTRDRWVPNLFLLLIPLACFLPSSPLIFSALLCLFLGLITSLARLNQFCPSFWSSRSAVYFGEISYSLYMTHTLAQKVLYKLLPSERFADASLMTKLFVTAGYLSVITAFCLGVYYLVEKPSRNWFRKVLNRKQ